MSVALLWNKRIRDGRFHITTCRFLVLCYSYLLYISISQTWTYSYTHLPKNTTYKHSYTTVYQLLLEVHKSRSYHKHTVTYTYACTHNPYCIYSTTTSHTELTALKVAWVGYSTLLQILMGWVMYNCRTIFIFFQTLFTIWNSWGTKIRCVTSATADQVLLI